MRKNQPIAFYLAVICTTLFLAAAAPVSAKEYFVLRGDLHVHSDFSHDCDVPLAQVIEESIQTGYDFIALTEHNTQNHLLEDHSVSDLIVLPGYELTLQTAHINLLGIREFDENIGLITPKEVTDYLNYIHELGGYASLNHPNDPNFPSRFKYNVPIDFIEVWNNARFGDDDLQTLNEWHELLVEGRKVFAVSGTDAHKNHLNRSPFNNVYVTEKTAEAILTSLKQGHNYITATADGPDIQLSYGDAIMGDIVEHAVGENILLTIDRLGPKSVIRVFSDQGLELEFGAQQEVSITKELPMDGRSFYRVEVWTSSGSMVAISNPIFID